MFRSPASDAEMTAFVKSPFYDAWREQVKAIGGCLQPVKLQGKHQVHDRATGRVLHDRSGNVLAACGTRRESLCPSCAARYAQDAFHLIRAGLSGDDTKTVPTGVSKAPRLVVTLTAPSFGAVHTHKVSKRGLLVPCACGAKHPETDTRVATPIDPDSYDYEHAVLWQAHSGALWHRWCTAVRRGLAQAGGVTVRDLRNHLVVSYSKVAEYQKRGMIHFHAVVRVDGPHGPGSTAPDWVTADLVSDVVTQATARVSLTTHRSTGEVLDLVFGQQVQPEPIVASDSNEDGLTESAIAGYVAKYATKSSGTTTTGIDTRIKSRDHIGELHVSEHHRRMMLTAWDLGGLESYQDLNLRKWAHMLGFRGHFLTKSQAYSTTFTKLRAARQHHQMAALLEQLDTVEDDVVVVNHWTFAGVGHDTDAQYELAQAISTTQLNQQHTKKE